MSRILLAWELGANLGHIDRLLLLARELRVRGHDCVFALRDLSRAHGRLAREGFAFTQAPLWLPRLARAPALGNYAAVLAAAGWLDPEGLAGLLGAWRLCIESLRPDVLVADHAPTALLAARAWPLGRAGAPLPCWAVGSSFHLPPHGEHFPPMRWWRGPQEEACRRWDQLLLAPTNRALALAGAPALTRLGQLFDGVGRCLTSLPELAHYGPHAEGEDFLGPSFVDDLGQTPVWPDAAEASAGGPATAPPRVFVYLEPAHRAFAPLLLALRELGWPTLAHVKGLSAEQQAQLQAPSLRIAAQPQRMDEVLRQASLVVSHGSPGMASAALMVGLPQLLLPRHVEQLMVARRLVDLGAGLAMAPDAAEGSDAGDAAANTATVRALLQRLVAEPGFVRRAAEVAARRAGLHPRHTARRMAERITQGVGA